VKTLILVLAFLTLGGVCVAANKVYRYRCSKCKLIQEYEVPGTKKCPNDGRIMIRMN
jgi:hypothetical protein